MLVVILDKGQQPAINRYGLMQRSLLLLTCHYLSNGHILTLSMFVCPLYSSRTSCVGYMY